MVTETMTIREWLTTYAHAVGEEALVNADVDYLDYKCSSLHSAINHGFNWSNTPEGFEYWNNLFNKLYKGASLYPPIPKEIEIW